MQKRRLLIRAANSSLELSQGPAVRAPVRTPPSTPVSTPESTAVNRGQAPSTSALWASAQGRLVDPSAELRAGNTNPTKLHHDGGM